MSERGSAQKTIDDVRRFWNACPLFVGEGSHVPGSREWFEEHERVSFASADFRFEDPAGNVLEAFHGPEIAPDPFRPGRAISGFRTGPLGMGHVVMNVERIDRVLPFYQDLLGFRLSDYTLRPFKAYFLHLNPRHHSFAMIETGHNSVHHMMVELFMLDDVGQAYDLALGEPGQIATTLGRHANDFMTIIQRVRKISCYADCRLPPRQ